MVKKNKLVNLYFILFFSFLASFAFSAEIIVPSGTDITLDYQTNSTLLKTSDTLVITRELVNNETFSLTGLYISENLPFPFEIVEQTVELNHVAIDYTYLEALYGMIIPGYNTYYWVIDDPDGTSGIENTINPDDSLSLILKVLCSQAGTYELSEHTVTFYSNGSAYFSYGDSSLEIVFEAGCCRGMTGNTDCAGPVEDPEAPDIADIVRLIDFLYLSHDPLCCLEEADVDVSGPTDPGDPFSAVDISDIVYLIDHLYLSHKDLLPCP